MNSDRVRSPQGLIFLPFSGPSMHPTLIDSDLLEILPTDGRDIDPGDVIAFLPAAGESYVIHRVLKIADGGITTRGDSNALLDPWIIQTSRLLGKVQAAWRGQRRIRIIGGKAGLIWSQCLQTVRKLDRMLSPKFHPIYRFLSKHGHFSCVLPKRVRPQVQGFTSNGGTGYKLIVGNRMVGWYDEELNVWRIRRPWRLVVGESRLTGIRNQELGEHASPSVD